MSAPSPAFERLFQPARAGASAIVRKQLRQVEKTAAKLDRRDPETLHDFRVAIRRLRSLLRAYGTPLDKVIPRGTKRVIRRVAHATNARRDIDVHLAWLRNELPTLSRHEQPGAHWLVAQLEADAPEASDALERAMGKSFFRTLRRLRKRLRKERRRAKRRPATTRRPPSATLADRTADVARALGDALTQHLTGIQSLTQQDEIHAARIEGKHLRYVLEPFAHDRMEPEIPGASAFIEQLKLIQDHLGDIHDADVFVAYITDQLVRAARDEARHAAAMIQNDGPPPSSANQRAKILTKLHDPMPGLVALAARLRARQRRCYGEAAERWLGTHADGVRHQTEILAAALQREGAGIPG